MSKPLIHRSNKAITASSVLNAIAADLDQIRREDGLTWADVGAVMHKSPDTAAKYADGSAEMGAVAFTLARREWNGRFTGSLDRLLAGARGEVDDRSKLATVLRAAMAIATSLEDDEQMDAKEVRQNRKALEEAREQIDALLCKLAPRTVVA